MAKQTFELVSPFLSIYCASKTWNGTSNLLLGQTTNHIVPGEFLEIDGSYGVIRGSGHATVPSFVFFSEPGRGDIVTGGKVPILQFGPYEADTSVYLRDVNGLPVGDLTTIGTAVSVTDVQDPGNPLAGAAVFTHRGIKVAVAGEFVVGYVSRVTGSGTNQKIRIMCGIGNNA